MKFSMGRNFTLLAMGHAIEFVKDEPTYVPPVLRKLALAQGAERVEDADEDESEDAGGGKTRPDDEAAVTADMNAVFETMILEDKKGTFTATGAPSMKMFRSHLGYDVDIKEMQAAWAAYKAK